MGIRLVDLLVAKDILSNSDAVQIYRYSLNNIKDPAKDAKASRILRAMRRHAAADK